MYRFAQSYGAIIGMTPLQAYTSALIFSPASSLTRTLFTSKEPEWIVQKPRVEQQWNGCLTTLSGHRDIVNSVAFSPDGHRIVSGGHDCCIKIWDSESGAERLTLRGHNARVWSVAFDEEGQFVTSKSDDETIKTWCAETGTCKSTSKGSRGPIEQLTMSADERRYADLFTKSHVRSLEFSRDGGLVASGLDDETVKIWDAKTGTEISTLHGHSGPVSSVCFSPDNLRIASGSWDRTIRIWDIEGISEISTLESHSRHRDKVSSVALTPDGRRIASGSRDGTVRIWDAETGGNIRTIEYDSGIWSVAYSPDGRCIAAGASNDTFVISDAESGATISTCGPPCVDPADFFLADLVALSLEGRYVATSWEQAVMIQHSDDGRNVLMLRGHSSYVTSLAFSTKDIRIVASGSADKTIKIWNVISEISTLNTGTMINLLRFDPTSAYLHISSSSQFRDSAWVSNAASSQNEPILPQIRQDRYGVAVDGAWITWNGQNILWLPPEFRDTESYGVRICDVLPHMISLGCPSGRIWWITFSSERHPFVL